MVLDPFELLGVTIESSPEDAKSSFQRLALLVHPDKNPGGGSQDQMIELLKAYKFVMMQLNLVNRTNTVENLENEFEEFCKAQKDADLDIRSRELREIIMGEDDADRLENEEKFREKFNEAFESRMKEQRYESSEEEPRDDQLIEDAFEPVSNKQGYGSVMAKSEYSAEVPVYKDTIDQSPPLPMCPLTVFSKDTNALIKASEMQLQMSRFFGNSRPGLNQCMSDYAEAFGPQDPVASFVESDLTLEERMKQLETERENMDRFEPPPSMTVMTEEPSSKKEVKKSSRFGDMFSFFWKGGR